MENKLRLPLLQLALLAAVLVSITYRFSLEELMVDRWLSAKHGSFDYSTMSCDFESNKPSLRYHLRHPRNKHVALLAFLSFAEFLSSYLYTKNG